MAVILITVIDERDSLSVSLPHKLMAFPIRCEDKGAKFVPDFEMDTVTYLHFEWYNIMAKSYCPIPEARPSAITAVEGA